MADPEAKKRGWSARGLSTRTGLPPAVPTPSAAGAGAGAGAGVGVGAGGQPVSKKPRIGPLESGAAMMAQLQKEAQAAQLAQQEVPLRETEFAASIRAKAKEQEEARESLGVAPFEGEVRTLAEFEKLEEKRRAERKKSSAKKAAAAGAVAGAGAVPKKSTPKKKPVTKKPERKSERKLFGRKLGLSYSENIAELDLNVDPEQWSREDIVEMLEILPKYEIVDLFQTVKREDKENFKSKIDQPEKETIANLISPLSDYFSMEGNAHTLQEHLQQLQDKNREYIACSIRSKDNLSLLLRQFITLQGAGTILLKLDIELYNEDLPSGIRPVDTFRLRRVTGPSDETKFTRIAQGLFRLAMSPRGPPGEIIILYPANEETKTIVGNPTNGIELYLRKNPNCSFEYDTERIVRGAAAAGAGAGAEKKTRRKETTDKIVNRMAKFVDEQGYSLSSLIKPEQYFYSIELAEGDFLRGLPAEIANEIELM